MSKSISDDFNSPHYENFWHNLLQKLESEKKWKKIRARIRNSIYALKYALGRDLFCSWKCSGRTGRAGQVGKAVTYFTEDDIPLMRPIANVVEHSGGSLPAYLLEVRKLDK